MTTMHDTAVYNNSKNSASYCCIKIFSLTAGSSVLYFTKVWESQRDGDREVTMNACMKAI